MDDILYDVSYLSTFLAWPLQFTRMDPDSLFLRLQQLLLFIVSEEDKEVIGELMAGSQV